MLRLKHLQLVKSINKTISRDENNLLLMKNYQNFKINVFKQVQLRIILQRNQQNLKNIKMYSKALMNN
jgi:hypothetical protein